jgi:hypothetical protein
VEGAILRRAKAGPPGGSAVALRELAKALGKTRGEGLERVNWYRGHWELRDETMRMRSSSIAVLTGWSPQCR